MPPKAVLSTLRALRDEFAARSALSKAADAADAAKYTRDIAPRAPFTPEQVQEEMRRQALANAPEQRMLQGFYRGFAGDNPQTPELFLTPQRRVADFYAQKRSAQTGGEPHAEMVLADPFAGRAYGHSTPGTGATEPMFTRARKVKESDVADRTQLYQSGGIVKGAFKHARSLLDDVLYHGGSYKKGETITQPLYMTPERAMAESYADPMRVPGAKLQELRPDVKNPAPERLVNAAARRFVPENRYFTPASAFDPNLHDPGDIAALIRELERRGYDSAVAGDVGMGGNYRAKGDALVVFPGKKAYAQGGAVTDDHTQPDMADGGRLIGDPNLYAGGGLVKGMLGAVKAAKEAPAVVIPGKMSRVQEEAMKHAGQYGAKRVQRAADEIQNLEKMFTEQALKGAFTGDNTKALATMNPAHFERYAQELEKRTDIGPKMSELARQGDINKYTVPTDSYIEHLMRLHGFDSVPYLNLFKDETGLPMLPSVVGHEGRHRSRALSGQGQPSSLVQINPRGALREGLPRDTPEEYIEALRRELGLTDNKVIPEPSGPGTGRNRDRAPIVLPDVYAEGGAVTGYFPQMKPRRAGRSNIGEELYKTAFIPQDMLDVALMAAPYGKLGKLAAAGAAALSPMEAEAGKVKTGLDLGRRALFGLKPSQEMAGRELVSKAEPTLDEMRAALNRAEKAAPKVEERSVTIDPGKGSAKVTDVVQKVAETPVSRRTVLKSAAGQVMQHAMPAHSFADLMKPAEVAKEVVQAVAPVVPTASMVPALMAKAIKKGMDADEAVAFVRGELGKNADNILKQQDTELLYDTLKNPFESILDDPDWLYKHSNGERGELMGPGELLQTQLGLGVEPGSLKETLRGLKAEMSPEDYANMKNAMKDAINQEMKYGGDY